MPPLSEHERSGANGMLKAATIVFPHYSSVLLTVPRRCFFFGSFLLVVFVFAILLVCFLQHCAHLLGKGWPLGYLVCQMFSCVLPLSHMVFRVRCGT